ncbi:MAG: ABC transporter permease subunit, partial [Atopobiaceae bacterium]|nr:ABC transporter permease subunit [Atopobiaceae bacterium]
MSFSTMLSTMAVGMLRTFGVFSLTLIGSLPLGMVVALLKKSRFAVVRAFISAYISIIRGTPLMLQLLVWYFGPFYLFGMNISGWRFPAVILGFILNYAAYFAEI